jgi:hypothetical protein
MIWVEILSRHRDVAARFRIAAQEARIGRGYDNDVVVDDPYVAAQHLRVFRDETGHLVAEDMGSANGMYLDGSKNRLARIIVDGKHPIRIGQTYLRVCDLDHAVEPERIAQPERRVPPIVFAAALGVAEFGIVALDIWLTQTSEPRISNYLSPLLAIAGMLIIWVGVWALLSRIFSGGSRFLQNLLIALEAFSDSGRQNTARLLMPPALRLAPLRDESAFFGDIAKLRAKIDGDRSQARADEARR